MKDENKELTKLNANQLGLISVDDLKDPLIGLDENEKKAYVATVAAAYEVLSKEIKNAMAKQEHFIGTTATSWEGVLIGRGSINMAYLLHERFDDLKAQHIDNIKPEEKFDKHEVI